MRRYTCDGEFDLEPLYAQIKTSRRYALLVLDGHEATLATMQGSAIRIIKEFESLIPSKTHKGGQSAARYERVVEACTKSYFHRIADVINNEFQSRRFDIIIGGSGFLKNRFAEAGLLNYQIKVLGCFNVGYTNENGIHELIRNAAELLKQEEIVAEKRAIDTFKKAVLNRYAVSGA